jgi:amino acid transporter
MSAIGSVLGTLLPMVFLIVLAGIYLASGYPSATPIHWKDLLPTQSTLANVGFFANILFSLLGIDVIAMHGGDVQKPRRTYPRVLWISGLIILISLILSSFAICVIVPPNQIGLVDGLIQAFDLFTMHYHIAWAHKLICLAIVLGGLGIVTSWMSGLARGLHAAAFSIQVPEILKKVNQWGMPYPILIAQAIIFSLLLSVFLIFPNINSSYWLLSSMTAQFAMLYYLVLFLAAAVLAKQQRLWLRYAPFIGLAIITIFIGFGVGFLPPTSVISKAQIVHYEMVLIFGGLAFLSPLAFLFYADKKSK